MDHHNAHNISARLEYNFRWIHFPHLIHHLHISCPQANESNNTLLLMGMACSLLTEQCAHPQTHCHLRNKWDKLGHLRNETDHTREDATRKSLSLSLSLCVCVCVTCVTNQVTDKHNEKNALVSPHSIVLISQVKSSCVRAHLSSTKEGKSN